MTDRDRFLIEGATLSAFSGDRSLMDPGSTLQILCKSLEMAVSIAWFRKWKPEEIDGLLRLKRELQAGTYRKRKK